MKQNNILGIYYGNITFNEALEASFFLLKNRAKSNLFFLNADCLYKAQNDEEYKNILNNADLVLPDGIGIKIITAIFGGRMKDNCAGTDFAPLLLEKAAELGYKIFFLGGRDGVAEKAAENIKKIIPRINIVGTHHGYFRDDADIIHKINDSGADVLFVAMGVPLQEKWIAKNREQLNLRLCIGVGAFLDYLSGRIPRAPRFMRALHLEWLWRLFIEPRRMFKRYVIDGTRLFWLVLKQKLGLSRF